MYHLLIRKCWVVVISSGRERLLEALDLGLAARDPLVVPTKSQSCAASGAQPAELRQLRREVACLAAEDPAARRLLDWCTAGCAAKLLMKTSSSPNFDE